MWREAAGLMRRPASGPGYRACHFGTGSAGGGGGTNAQAPNPKPAAMRLWLSGQFTIQPGGSGGGWVQSLLPCPGSWSSSTPPSDSLSVQFQ